MQLLFLYPRKLDKATSVGGVAEFLFEISPRLNALGINTYVYAGDKNRRSVSEIQEVIPGLFVYHGPFIKPSLFVSPRKLNPILDICRRHHIDVVHAEGVYSAGFSARLIYRKLNIPYVVTSHSDVSPKNSARIGRRNVVSRCKKILKDAAMVTHLTPEMAQFSHDILDTRDKSVMIGNGVSVADWYPSRSLPKQNYMIGMGRLEPGKGFHVLIEMYARLVSEGITTSLIIAGKGQAEEALHHQARVLGLNTLVDFSDFEHIPEQSVIFTGYLRGEDKYRLIAASQCVLFATQPALWDEAFGIVQLEAMAAGRPLIASDTVATRYLKQAGLAVLTVSPADVAAWAETVSRFLKDETLGHLMSEANIKASDQFDWSVIAKQYAEVFRSALHPAYS